MSKSLPPPPVDRLLVEPGPDPDQWDETPAQAARADRDYWTDRDWGGQPDDPSDHYDY